MAEEELRRITRHQSDIISPGDTERMNTTFRTIQEVQYVGFSELNLFDLDPGVAPLLEREFCRQHHVVILGSVSTNPRELVYLGMLDPKSRDAARAVEKVIARRVVPVQLNEYEIDRAIAHIYGEARAAREDGPMLELSSARKITFEPDQAPSLLLDDLLSEGVRRRASDVHIEVFRDDVDLRFRVDGVLLQVTTALHPSNVGRVISRVKALAELDIAEKRVPQDGRINSTYLDGNQMRRVQLRVSVVPGIYGEECVLRILDPAQTVKDLSLLGMPTDVLGSYRRLIRRPYGLILVAGPTCCGKSTTLYCTLKERYSPEIKILTAEDPVEYEFAKISQKSVTEQVGFAEFTRAFLRQNPDMLLIGEVRDPDTARECIRAANTGHLVFSTLHTGDALSAVSRLRALGVADDFVADVLIGVLAQRLVRKLCPGCKREEPPNTALLPLFYPTPPDHAFFGPQGCDACDGTGYRGRVGVYELFRVTHDVSRAIARGTPAGELLEGAAAAGYRVMAHDALAKVAAGITSLDEVARVVNPLVE